MQLAQQKSQVETALFYINLLYHQKEKEQPKQTKKTKNKKTKTKKLEGLI